MNEIAAKRVISFDVGIKNMAYCIFEIDQTGGMKITDWQVLNLIEREPTITEKCQVLNKKAKKKDQSQKQQCQKPSKYKYSVGTQTQTFCEKHAKESTFILPKDKLSSSKLKKMDIEELNQHLQKYSQSIHQTKKSAIENLEKYMQENSLELIQLKKKSANDLDLITLGQNMMLALDQNTHIEGITHVIIENQISPIANRMKTVQGMLAQYFIMRVPGCHIEFVSSANKLKAFTSSKSDENLPAKQKDEYKQHKRDGVYYCDQVLQQNKQICCWQDTFNFSKKKDDLADAFLQGLWYTVNKKWVILDIDKESYIIK
jgi:hypothetical protein